jgi:hypothetical protein
VSPAADKGLLNYTTKVPVDRTVNEMQTMLGQSGARRVAVEWENGIPSALSFTLDGPHGERLYTLPVDVPAIQRVLREQLRAGTIRSHHGNPATPDQAARVAWRVLKDWLEAQLALIRTTMAPLDQVMLPYVHVDRELTLYDAWREHETLALPSADGA